MPPVPVSSQQRATAEQDASDFDPKLTLSWPGIPTESRRRLDAGTAHETTIYSATYSQTDPATVFEASVYQISEQDLRASNPQELLAGHMTSDDDKELSRKPILHGPQKYPAFDVTLNSGESYFRRITVMAGRRLYSVNVGSVKKERLSALDVTKFLDSFRVQE